MIHVVSNICGIAEWQLETRQSQLHEKASLVSDPDQLHYSQGYPESMPVSVQEREKNEGFSYLSKFYALKDVIEKTGATRLLWLDATMWLRENWHEVMSKQLDDTGLFLVNMGDGRAWTHDRFYSMINKRREDFTFDLVAGGVFAFDLLHENGKVFWDALCEYSKKEDMWFGSCGYPYKPDIDENTRGHRHDQCVMGWVAHKFDLPFTQDDCFGPHFYSQSYLHQDYESWKEHVAKFGLGTEEYKSIDFPKNAIITHHPTKWHFCTGLKRQ